MIATIIILTRPAQIVQLLGRRLLDGDDLQVGQRQLVVVRRLQQQA